METHIRQWFRENHAVFGFSRRRSPSLDVPLVARLRKQESVIREDIIGPVQHLKGFVQSFALNFSGSTFSASLAISRRGVRERREYGFFPGLVLKDRLSFLCEDDGRRQFYTYNPDCMAFEIKELLIEKFKPWILGASSEFVAMRRFATLAKAHLWIRYTRFSTDEEDHKGADIFVKVARAVYDPIEVPIQVKSSIYHQMEHINREGGTSIPSMVVPLHSTYDALAPLMKELLVRYVEHGEILHIAPHRKPLRT